jgi:nucleotide-binding universal stress UspA family protein
MATQTVATAVGIHRVLVAIDFSEASDKALRHAVAIARSYGAKFYLTHVASAMGFTLAGGDAAALAADGADRDLRRLEENLAKTGALDGIQHEIEVCQGEVWQQLERVIEEKHVDLVVVGTHGRTGLRKVAFGSVAEAVFRHSICPVLTVGPFAPSDPPAHAVLRHILYPTDLSEESAVAAGYAESLARQHGARLTVVHIAERPGDAKTDEREREFEANFRKHAPGRRPHDWTFRTQLGPIDKTILELAEEGHVGLIVLGLRSPLSSARPNGWPHAYKIACEACCPVLNVRCDAEFRR